MIKTKETTPPGFKRCTYKACKDPIQPTSEFNKNTGKKDGLQNRCRTCQSEARKARYLENREGEMARTKSWRQENRERVRENDRALYAANPEKARAESQAWRAANPEKTREISNTWKDANREYIKEYDLLRKYGITPQQLDIRLSAINNLCEICHLHPANSVDHDHSCCLKPPACGECVRGITCRSCNSGLGYVNDSVTILTSMASYLENNLNWPIDPSRKISHRNTDPKEKYRREWLYRQYHITLEEYNWLLELQGGCCAICEKTPDYNLYVDHCHETAMIRGLLCRPCNFGVGHFQNSIEIVVSGIDYLSTWKDKLWLPSSQPN